MIYIEVQQLNFLIEKLLVDSISGFRNHLKSKASRYSITFSVQRHAAVKDGRDCLFKEILLFRTKCHMVHIMPRYTFYCRGNITLRSIYATLRETMVMLSGFLQVDGIDGTASTASSSD